MVSEAQPIVLNELGPLDVARISEVLKAADTAVTAGEPLFIIETHKVSLEVVSPASGVLFHGLSTGDFVKIGVPIAFVGTDLKLRDAHLRIAQGALSQPYGSGENGGDVSEGELVTIAKASEIEALQTGASFSTMSAAGVVVGRIRRRDGGLPFFSKKIIDLVVYEASRLLKKKKFTRLNAYYKNGRIVLHSHVSPGIGFDEGERLTAYTLPNADALDLPKTQEKILEGLLRYVDRNLSANETTQATFTLSDMSASSLSFAFPLVPVSQSMILAITQTDGVYSLFSGFDHRVSEGMVVAAFLSELAERLRSFSQPEEAITQTIPCCSFCRRTLTELTEMTRNRGLLHIQTGATETALCCAACWEGW